LKVDLVELLDPKRPLSVAPILLLDIFWLLESWRSTRRPYNTMKNDGCASYMRNQGEVGRHETDLQEFVPYHRRIFGSGSRIVVFFGSSVPYSSAA
jgi:hypothetical protein